MSTELGIGTRVWIGWTPNCHDPDKDALCRTGTILDGPRHHRVEGCATIFGSFDYWHAGTYWYLFIDGIGYGRASERLLFPVDDGIPVEFEDTAEVEVA